MFKILKKLDKQAHYYVAFSGGKDSVAFTHYLVSLGFYNLTLLHFNHKITSYDDQAEEFTKSFSKTYGLKLILGYPVKDKSSKQSPEDYQREQRYLFLDSFQDSLIILCHNLNDNAETWLFGSINGTPKLIPYKRNNCIRPFMLNSNQLIYDYLKENNLQYFLDKTNNDINIPRNYIRHVLMKNVLEVNKGFLSMIKRKLVKKIRAENYE